MHNELTICQAKRRGQQGTIFVCLPCATALVIGDDILPSEGGIPIHVARKRSLS